MTINIEKYEKKLQFLSKNVKIRDGKLKTIPVLLETMQYSIINF